MVPVFVASLRDRGFYRKRVRRVLLTHSFPCFFSTPNCARFLESGERVKYSLFGGVFSLAKDRMERNSLMQIAKFLRYNSPSKRQIRRMVGRPKAPNAKELAAQAAAREPLLYTKKEDAPFAVRAFLFSPLIQ